MSEKMPKLPLGDFYANLGIVLPKLIAFVHSDFVRKHAVWGRTIPYGVPAYGVGGSPGYCVRPDVLLTSQGPKICELDFVPSGRGFTLEGLTKEQGREFLGAFARWYRQMETDRIFYATASTTICLPETKLFCNALREVAGVDIQAGNIDAADLCELRRSGMTVDRLSYRAEMDAPSPDHLTLAGLRVTTAEPYLDSKAILALVHCKQKDVEMQLKAALGDDGLKFLRQAVPETHLLSNFNEGQKNRVYGKEHRDWVLKNTDVENHETWGSRGVVVGACYSSARFTEALFGKPPGKKVLGENPVIQRYHGSRDFWQTWDAAVRGDVQRTGTTFAAIAKDDPTTGAYATASVGARIGFYLLVVASTGEVIVPPYACMTLRQNEVVHGASDALYVPVTLDERPTFH